MWSSRQAWKCEAHRLAGTGRSATGSSGSCAEDPGRWSYTALAAAVGCSPELVAAIVKGRTRTS